MLLWRTRVSILWIILGVSASAGALLTLIMPGMLNDVLEGQIEGMEITGGLLAFYAIFWIVPFAMAFLTLVLRDPVNRYTTLVVGVLATAMWVWDLIEQLAGGEALAGLILLTATGVATGLAILWHTWKWPKTKEESLPIEEVIRIPAGTGTHR